MIPDNWDGWDETIEQSRSQYGKIRLQHEAECRQQQQEEKQKSQEPKQDNTKVNNPLSTEEDVSFVPCTWTTFRH